MPDRNIDRVNSVMSVAQGSPPHPTTVPHKQTIIRISLYLCLTLCPHCPLLQPINEEEGLTHPDRGSVEQYAQMRCQPTLVLVQDTIAIHHQQLRTQLGRDAGEEVVKRRYLPKGQETRDIGLVNPHNLTVLVQHCVGVRVVDYYTRTNQLRRHLRSTQIHPCNSADGVHCPSKCILLHYGFPYVRLLTLPLHSNCGIHVLVRCPLLHIYYTRKINVQRRYISELIMTMQMKKGLAGRLVLWRNKLLKEYPLPQKVRHVSLGPTHGAAITASGNLYTFGSDQFGQLGNRKEDPNHKPYIVSYFQKQDLSIENVVCGHNLTVVQTTKGEVYFMGLLYKKAWIKYFNNKTYSSEPVKIVLPENEKAKIIAAGDNCLAIVTDSGRVYNMGNNSEKCFGDGSNNSSIDKVYLNEAQSFNPSDPNECISKLSLVKYSGALVQTKGLLYTWGLNNNGNLGVFDEGRDMNSVVPNPNYVELPNGELVEDLSMSEEQTLILCKSGNMFRLGKKMYYTPQKVSIKGKVVCFATDDQGIAYLNDSNQIIDNQYFDKIVKKNQVGFHKLLQQFDSEVIGFGGYSQDKYLLLK